MAKQKPPSASRDMTIALKVSPQEYQLIAYAASKSRARGLQMWVRDRLLEAAKEKVPEKTAEQILEGNATAALLRESLKNAPAAKTARVLAFRGKPARKDHA
jgi:uncharacterized protein (DUF1778 family)